MTYLLSHLVTLWDQLVHGFMALFCMRLQELSRCSSQNFTFTRRSMNIQIGGRSWPLKPAPQINKVLASPISHLSLFTCYHSIYLYIKSIQRLCFQCSLKKWVLKNYHLREQIFPHPCLIFKEWPQTSTFCQKRYQFTFTLPWPLKILYVQSSFFSFFQIHQMLFQSRCRNSNWYADNYSASEGAIWLWFLLTVCFLLLSLVQLV